MASRPLATTPNAPGGALITAKSHISRERRPGQRPDLNERCGEPGSLFEPVINDDSARRPKTRYRSPIRSYKHALD